AAAARSASHHVSPLQTSYRGASCPRYGLHPLRDQPKCVSRVLGFLIRSGARTVSTCILSSIRHPWPSCWLTLIVNQGVQVQPCSHFPNEVLIHLILIK